MSTMIVIRFHTTGIDWSPWLVSVSQTLHSTNRQGIGDKRCRGRRVTTRRAPLAAGAPTGASTTPQRYLLATAPSRCLPVYNGDISLLRYISLAIDNFTIFICKYTTSLTCNCNCSQSTRTARCWFKDPSLMHYYKYISWLFSI